MPHIIMIAGPNGSGKSTSAPALLRGALHVDDFLNADVIAQGLCAFQPEKVAIDAGRIMLNRMRRLARDGVSFAFETTLASRTFAGWIPALQRKGYHFHLFFLWLHSAELAVSRVKERVKRGGHFIPEGTVKRRYVAGLRNLFSLYCPIADSWNLYDNSLTKGSLALIAAKLDKENLVVENTEIWGHLFDRYGKNQKG